MFCNVIAVNIEQVIMFTLEAFEFSALLDFYLQSFLNVVSADDGMQPQFW